MHRQRHYLVTIVVCCSHSLYIWQCQTITGPRFLSENPVNPEPWMSVILPLILLNYARFQLELLGLCLASLTSQTFWHTASGHVPQLPTHAKQSSMARLHGQPGFQPGRTLYTIRMLREEVVFVHFTEFPLYMYVTLSSWESTPARFRTQAERPRSKAQLFQTSLGYADLLFR